LTISADPQGSADHNLRTAALTDLLNFQNSILLTVFTKIRAEKITGTGNCRLCD